MIIDIIVAILIVIACIKGYQKGFILSLFSIIAFIIGLAAALKFSTIVAGYIKGSISVSAKWLPFISFIIIFLITVLLVRLGGKLIEKTFQMAMLGWLNRIAGVILYAILYMIILSVFLFYAEKLQLLQPSLLQSSKTYSFLQPWGPKIIDEFGRIIPIFKDMFTELENFFDGISNKI